MKEDTVKRSSITAFGISEGEKRGNGQKQYLKINWLRFCQK